jgi:hypothetical protein
MQGRIADFGIPDIFQLVSSQGKSGSLAIRGDERDALFYFADGMIVDVQPDRRDPSGMLGRMLTDAGIITVEELKRGLAEQLKSGKKLGEHLLEKDKVTRDTLIKFLNLQLKETVFDVLKLKDGEYRFEGYAVRPSAIMGDPVRPDVLMMEGMQFLDEYPRYREKFPGGDFRVTRKKGVKIDPSALAPEERIVWKAIDFSDEPSRIYRRALLTEFEGIKGLHSLLDRGLVEISVADESKGSDRRGAIKAELDRRYRIAVMRGVLWAAAGIATALWLFNIMLSPDTAWLFSSWAGFF